MTGKEAVKAVLTSTKNWLNMYVADLSDADILVRPVPGANNIAWQLNGEPFISFENLHALYSPLRLMIEAATWPPRSIRYPS